MNSNSLQSRRILSARRVVLLATTIAGIGAAAFFLTPNMVSIPFGTAAHAQNLTEKVQQLPQKPVGFADIVERVKPAVISVRVKIDRPAATSQSDGDLPFPPGSPFERFFKRFGMPNMPNGHEIITGQGSGFVWCQGADLADYEATRPPFLVAVLHKIGGGAARLHSNSEALQRSVTSIPLEDILAAMVGAKGVNDALGDLRHWPLPFLLPRPCRRLQGSVGEARGSKPGQNWSTTVTLR